MKRLHTTILGVTAAFAVLATAGACVPAQPSGTVARITASPDGALADQPVRIAVSGLAPRTKARLWAYTVDKEGQRWTSWATMTTDGAGRVDSTTRAESGSYTGVDPHGLFWSMRLSAGRTAAYPAFAAARLSITVGVDVDGTTAARTVLNRRLWAAGVTHRPVTAGGLVGDLYLPPGVSSTSRRPGVLLLGGSEGGRPDPGYAGLLASKGFVVLGLAYFGVSGRPAELFRIPVEYGLAGARWLGARPEVAGPKVGVIGTSKGGEYTLLLASTAPELFGAVVSNVGSDVAWSGISYTTGKTGSSWTRGGRDVPALTIGFGSGFEDMVDLARGHPMKVRGSYAGGFANAPASTRAAARFPVERITSPLLFTSGGDDAIWPSVDQSNRALRYVQAGRNRYGAAHLSFPHAGHFVGGVPNLPSTSTGGISGGRAAGVALAYGGTATANAAASRETFIRTVALLTRGLRTGSNS